ncbi:MAG: uracil-DNA glycosylase [Lentisphaeria bacterium]|nr:uracil-DNA glycosylase [Lentisphaeria bacterium]
MSLRENFLTALIPSKWRTFLAESCSDPGFERLADFVKKAYESGPVYPPQDKIFRAFDLTPPEAVTCVLLGQDPYHGPGQAEGLCFSVPPGVPPPPSLRNVFKELGSDTGQPEPMSGSLVPWARQGVLLLNTALTVNAGSAGSHADQGWERLTDAVLAGLNARAAHPLVYILWGGQARKKAVLIDEQRHCVIASAHPSPLSAYRGFFGSRPFSRTNAFLRGQNLPVIDWRLPCQPELKF